MRKLLTRDLIRMARMGAVAALVLALCAAAEAVPIRSLSEVRPAASAEDFSSGLLDRAKVIEAAKGITPEKYPNSDDILVDDHIFVRYQRDGTAVIWDDTFNKVLTEKGRRDNRTLSFHFTVPYSTVEVKLLEVIKPDGTVVPVDVKAQSKVMVDRSQMGSNIYNPNNKVYRVSISGLEIGDMVRYVSHRNEVKTRMPDTWSDWTILEWNSPIKHFIYEVKGPKALPLRNIKINHAIKDSVVSTRKEEGSTIFYRWEAADIPRMYDEPSMPPRYTVVQHLIVTTIPDWKTVSRWYWGLCKPNLDAVTPEMEQKVKEITKGLASRQEKIEAIFRWVSQEVRYLGITVEKEAPGYEPHPVKMTFEKRHGVCRDKAALLVAMLRLVGYEAFPVLIHNGPKKDPDAPAPYFNHAVSCVENEDGSYMLMDSTDENTKRIFPSYLCDQSYLVAKPEGETLLTSPIVPAEENMMFVDTRAALDEKGTLTGETTLTFEGINDNAYRGFFSRKTPEERRRYFESVVKRVAAGARLLTFEMEPKDVMDTSAGLKTKLTFEAPDLLISGKDVAMLPLPRFGLRVGMVNFLLGRTGLEERKYPLKTDIACGARETVTIELGDAVGKPLGDLPEAQLDNETVRWAQSVSSEKGVLTARNEFKLKVVEFSPEEYLSLKSTLKTIEYDLRRSPIFAAGKAVPTGTMDIKAGPGPEPDADTELVREDVTVTLSDGGSWTEVRTVERKILTYAGKKRYSELKFNYNPVWDEVLLEHAATVKDGKVKEISKEELNIMDAGWVGSAPRYPGGKTLVASLPGVEVGSTIMYRVKRVYRSRPFFSWEASFRSYDPIREKTLTVVAPETVPLSIFESGIDESVRAVRRKDGKLTYSWTLKDQKAVKTESSLPPWWSLAPTVFVSGGEWERYAAQVHRALEKAAGSRTEAGKKAREVIGGKNTDREKIEAIRDFVSINTRSAGPSLTSLPLSSITGADRVLSDGYGNTSDRAVLLHAMLTEAGLKPEFVLASGAARLKPLQAPLVKAPPRSWFGTVLVRVKLEEEYVYLNDTNQYAALGATHHDGRPGILLPSGEIVTIAAMKDRRNRSETEYAITMKPDTDGAVRRTRNVYGTSFQSFHRRYVEMPPEERRRHFQEMVAGISQAAKADGELVTKYDDYPAVEEFAVDIDKYAVLDGDHYYFTLPDSFAGLLSLRSDTRANPVYWGSPSDTALKLTINLPRGYVLSLPAEGEAVTLLDEKLPSDAGSVTITAKTPKPGVLDLTFRAMTVPALIPPEDYGKLLDIQRRLAHPRMRTVILRRQ